MSDIKDMERLRAAEAAAALVEPGMRLGLGTGRAAFAFVRAVGARVAGGLALPPAVSTSSATEALAREHGITVCDLLAADAPTRVDLAVDGADEIDDALRLIKGGGGSLLREKIVAHMAARFVVIAESSKRVAELGAFALPVEVVPFGWQATSASVAEALGVAPVLRRSEGAVRVTDNANYILDCPMGRIADPEGVAARLSGIVGVVEHGLFLTEADETIVGMGDTVERRQRAR
ncbi:MAG: ribose-5-phosphate isomerase RpiA [Acuticoccus sp.]